jgi:hypothetical protein
LPTLLYCRCAYAQVINPGVKDDVLRQLGESGSSFESVSDLCEMAAHRDPRLSALSECAARGGLRIAACHPRAVKGLFRQAGVPLADEHVEIHNMREFSSDAVVEGMLRAAPASPAASDDASPPLDGGSMPTDPAAPES